MRTLIYLACALCALVINAPQPLLTTAAGAQTVKKSVTDSTKQTEAGALIEAQRISADFAVDDFDNPAWQRARAVKLARYWSGAPAPATRQAEARLLWSQAALYVRFTARQGEPLIVSDKPRLDQKTMNLWDRDVCELFVAPNADAPERYYEFEVAPTGEWIDLGIHWSPGKRETDWAYHSGATFAARTGKDSITLTMRIPWTALGGAPKPGARWRANLFRCVGADPTRGYLAWQPTLTAEPSFHVPQRFGWLQFKG
jgi:hypothetical protein